MAWRRNPEVEDRRAQCDAWAKGVGIDLHLIVDEEKCLIVAPINEGELHARWRQIGVPPVVDHTGLHYVTHPTEAIVTDPPPGFALPEWDAHRYIYTGRGCDRD